MWNRETIRSRFLLLMLCAIPVVAQEAAGEIQAGGLQFRIPPGWQRATRDQMTVFVPPDLPAGKMVILAVTGDKDSSAAVRDCLDEEWNTWKRRFRMTSESPVNVLQHRSGMDIAMRSAQAADNGGNRFFFLLLVAADGRRAAPLLFMSNADNLLSTHSQMLQGVIAGLRMAPAPASPAPPPATAPAPLPDTGDRLNGVYRTWTWVTSYNAQLGIPTREMGFDHWAFFPDGRFYYAVPPEGMENFSYAALCRRNPNFCGSYQMSGGRGTLRFADTGRTMPLMRDGDQILINGKPHKRLDPGDGVTLDGTFRRDDYQGTVLARAGITFTAAGRFADEGLPKAIYTRWWNESRGYWDDDGVPGRGTYHISNYTLELKYDDGRRKRFNFYIEPGTPKSPPREVRLGGWKLIRTE